MSSFLGSIFETFTLDRRWIFIFGLWLLFLSGSFATLFGPPGILQAIRLKNLLEEKKLQSLEAQKELKRLRHEVSQLEKNHFIQEREIRRVLGYVGNDEIIFDFTPSGY